MVTITHMKILPRGAYVNWRGHYLHGPDQIDWQWVRMLIGTAAVMYPFGIMLAVMITGIFG